MRRHALKAVTATILALAVGLPGPAAAHPADEPPRVEVSRAVESPPVVDPPVVAASTAAVPDGFLVAPYLQHPGADRITVSFEPTPEAIGPVMVVEHRVLGGDGAWTSVLAVQEERSVLNDEGHGAGEDLVVFHADLEGLPSDTVHEYRVTTAAGTTGPATFKTWPVELDGVEEGRFLVFSDVQGQNIDTWFRNVLDDVIDVECGGDVAACVTALDGIIIPGDLVDRGSNIDDWRDEYFAPAADVFAHLPQIPAIGNHDAPIRHYLYYFHPPTNDSPGFQDEWYALDFLNVRLLTMQSTINGARLLERALHQRIFMVSQLTDAATRDDIDYVFMNIHAPCKSELWIPGEMHEVCVLVDLLERYSAQTGAITGHFFGHTHGYSRGQSRDVPHLWLNAASAGGAIDDFGQFEMADYDEFESTWDEYGYVVVQFATTGTPEVRVERRSGGDDVHGTYEDAFKGDKVRDRFVIGGDNTAPAAPVPTAPGPQVAGPDVVLEAAFDDPDGDALMEGHWQVIADGGDFATPDLDVWGNDTRAHNLWFRTDLNATSDPTAYRLPYLEAGDYCWRVRFRDARWAWSDFSAPACFSVDGYTEGADLIVNGGAESGGQPSVEGWTVETGRVEAVNGSECQVNGDPLEPEFNPPIAHEGLWFFSIGGCTGDVADSAVVTQVVDVSEHADDIDAGRTVGVLRAALRTYYKWDSPTARFTALDGDGTALFTSPPLSNQDKVWEDAATTLVLPTGTRSVRVMLTGTRQDGTSNDSFVDDVRFNVVTQPEPRSPFTDFGRFSPADGMALSTYRWVTFPFGPHVAAPVGE